MEIMHTYLSRFIRTPKGDPFCTSSLFIGDHDTGVLGLVEYEWKPNACLSIWALVSLIIYLYVLWYCVWVKLGNWAQLRKSSAHWHSAILLFLYRTSVCILVYCVRERVESIHVKHITVSDTFRRSYARVLSASDKYRYHSEGQGDRAICLRKQFMHHLFYIWPHTIGLSFLINIIRKYIL